MKSILDRLVACIGKQEPVVLSSSPEGLDMLILADLARALAQQGAERPVTLVFRIGIASLMIAFHRMRVWSHAGCWCCHDWRARAPVPSGPVY